MSILKDKVIVLIGASSGIGESLCEYFANQGAKVYAYARRVELLEKLADRCENIRYGKCDAMNNADLIAVRERALAENGNIDVWINCVGQNKAIGKIWELDVDDIWNEVEVDLKSCIAGTHTALQHMIKVDSGIIINFCGGGTDKPHIYAAGYSAAKTGVARFNESLHLELTEDKSNIKVFGIQPGLVLNERTKQLCIDENSRKYMPEIEVAFKEGRHADPLRTAYFLEYALDGKMDKYRGQVIFPGDVKKLAAQNDTPFPDPLIGFLRVRK